MIDMNGKHRDLRSSLRTSALSFLATALLALAAQPALAAESAFEGVVNLNTANVVELQLLPGIGESRAAAIVALRQQRGGFKSVDELVDVKGIGDAMLDRLKPYVRTSGKTTARVI